MRFEPLTDASKLPDLGAGAEHALWELKKGVSTKPYHLAKDIAAFANHYGGTILIGAEEANARVHAYHPMTLTKIGDAETAFRDAAMNLCSPQPQFNYARFEKDGGWVLAVNVWPSVATIIGVKVQADKARCGYGDDAYVFPIRIVNHSDTITPETFPMHMLPELRRILLLLYAIPKDADLSIFWHRRNAHAGVFPDETSRWKLLEVDERRNFVNFQHDGGSERRIALDAVFLVFCGKEHNGRQTWQIHAWS